MQLINRLQFCHWQGDLSGGLTAAMATVPLAMVFGEASGLGVLAGLYGAIIVGFITALLGGVATRISAPTVSLMLLVLLISSYFNSLPFVPIPVMNLVFVTIILSGFIQVLFALLRLGRLVDCIPHPIISGFMSAIGLSIILTQIAPLFGAKAAVLPLDALMSLEATFAMIHQDTLLLGVMILLIVFLLPRALPRLHQVVSAPLVALIAGVFLTETLFSESKLHRLGEIPLALPELTITAEFVALDWQLWLAVFGFAVVLALVSSFNSLLTAQVVDQITKMNHQSKRELVGQGVANSAAGLLGAMPAAAATLRSVANIRAGGTTELSGLIYALALLASVLFFSDYLSNFPSVILAAILIKLGFDVVDWELLKNIGAVTAQGKILVILVVIISVLLNPLAAVVIVMCVSVFMSLKMQASEQAATMVIADHPVEQLNLSAEEKLAFEAVNGRAVLLSLTSTLSFVSAYEMKKQTSSFSDYDVLIFDLTNVPAIDFTVTKIFDELIEKAIENGREVMLVGVRSQLGKILKHHRVMDRVHSDYRFVKLVGALRQADHYIKHKTIGF